jgi:hypothetical protein
MHSRSSDVPSTHSDTAWTQIVAQGRIVAIWVSLLYAACLLFVAAGRALFFWGSMLAFHSGSSPIVTQLIVLSWSPGALCFRAGLSLLVAWAAYRRNRWLCATAFAATLAHQGLSILVDYFCPPAFQ